MKLQNMIIKEVSLVDKPANKRKFLLFKRDIEKGVSQLKIEDFKKFIEENNEKELNKIFDVLSKSEALEKGLKELEEATAELEKKVAEVKKAEEAIKKQEEMMQCADCDWKGQKIDLKEGKCPKCGSSSVSEIQEAEKKKAVHEAKVKLTEELTKKHSDEIASIKKEYDAVFEELVKAVESLRNVTLTKKDVQEMVSEAIAEFKKSVK